MGKIYKKHFEEIVNVWVEMMYMQLELYRLDDYSYEVYELYELDGRYDITDENEDGEEISVIKMYGRINHAGDIASSLVSNAEKILKAQICEIIEHGLSGKFFGEEIVNINSQNIDSVFELMFEIFMDDIYSYSAGDQYDRFIKRFVKEDKLINR